MTMEPTLLLSDRDVRQLLPMPECIDIMQHALESVAQGSSILPLRTVIRLDGTPNAFASMPAVHGSGGNAALGAKVITVFPGNEATPYDSHIGVVLLFDAEHGFLRSISDASSITAIRTAAVSGLATRLLAREDSSTLALLGAGVLGMPHIEAVRAGRDIRHVRIWSRGTTRARELARQVHTRFEVDVTVTDDAESAVREADIICTITSSRTPVLKGEWVAPGTHINAVGASLPTARELDTYAVQRAALFVDRRESALAEAGDFLLARAEGAIDDTHILGEIGEISTRAVPGRVSADQVTVFKSVGLAVEDIAAAQHIERRAREEGIGVPIRIGGGRTGWELGELGDESL